MAVSDTRLRSLERQANPADPHAQAALLAGRQRANEPGAWVACDARDKHGTPATHKYYACGLCNGTGRVPLPWPRRLELAAYAGDEGARLITERGECKVCKLSAVHDGDVDPTVDYEVCVDSINLKEWLTGLEAWPQCVLTRAAVAAARVVLPVWESGALCNHRHETEQALDTCLSAPRRAIEAAEAWLADPTEATEKTWRSAWVASGRPGDTWIPGLHEDPSAQMEVTIASAVIETSEPAVRQGIQSALIEWALA